MAPVLMYCTGTSEPVHVAVKESQQNVNAWLKNQVPESTMLQHFQINTLNEASQATGGIMCTHTITRMVNQE